MSGRGLIGSDIQCTNQISRDLYAIDATPARRRCRMTHWLICAHRYRCGPCPRKIVGDLAKLLKEEEAVQCVKNFGAELKKNGSTDPVKFIFNDSRRIYYARTDRSSSRSPGAPRRKKAKTAPAPAPAPEDTAKLGELLDG